MWMQVVNSQRCSAPIYPSLVYNSQTQSMSSTNIQPQRAFNEEDILLGLQLATGTLVQMALKAALELNLLEIMASGGPGKQFSVKEIAARLPTQNPDAPDMLDRILRLLASYSVLTCSQVTGDDDSVQRLYGLAPVCKFFLPNKDGISVSPLLLMIHHKANMLSCGLLKDAVLEGGISFNKAHGMPIYEYLGTDPSFNQVFNQTMFNLSVTLMHGILGFYDGFEKANVIVDVGGGLGENLGLIISKYPTIKGINYDLPHVIAAAHPYPGVEHVIGNMFSSIPKGDIIFLKLILHNWGDDHCSKILKKCYEALPEDGKVVVVETVLPEEPETTLPAKNANVMDVLMMSQHDGGRERTEKEYKTLAKGAGFNGYKLSCRVLASSVMEFLKNM